MIFSRNVVVMGYLLPVAGFLPMISKLLQGGQEFLEKSEVLKHACSVTSQPYRIPYIRRHVPVALEPTVCFSTSLLDHILQPSGSVNEHFLRDSMAAITFIVATSSLENGEWATVLVTFVSIFLAGAAVFPIFPIFSVYFIMTTYRRKRYYPGMNLTDSEALTGAVAGYVMPIFALLWHRSMMYNILWLASPPVCWMVILLHHIDRYGEEFLKPGSYAAYGAYIAIFILTFIIHFHTLFTYGLTLKKLGYQWLPPSTNPDIEISSELPRLARLIQGDDILIFWSALIYSLRYAETILQLVGFLSWGLIGFVIFGPEAALSGVWIWRERMLYGRR
ncbi:hypothetical protein M422DRAFT_53818 [Sphaerobolus stellatus SS14]|uniref:Uncharacterized protein n=1 Tax=Sphaerobolus stellatus (strain SS14) TaxID=990650 RepID=A0A0C9UY79_SPHS4|nr:hypothetical protein M422DRAFT_53818 [Sphaerobolus stellatus SS14]